MGPRLMKQTARDERTARTQVTERDGGLCVRCLRGDPTNFDHRKNRSQGGLWSASNGQLLCGSGTTGCHGWVTVHPHQAIIDGWAVPGWADPAEYPAARWFPTPLNTLRKGWVLLDDMGAVLEVDAAEAELRMTGRWNE